MAAVNGTPPFDIDRVSMTATAWTDMVVGDGFRRVTVRNETVPGVGANRVRVGSPSASGAFVSTHRYVDLGPGESLTINLGGGDAQAPLSARTLKISVDTNPTVVSFTQERAA